MAIVLQDTIEEKCTKAIVWGFCVLFKSENPCTYRDCKKALEMIKENQKLTQLVITDALIEANRHRDCWVKDDGLPEDSMFSSAEKMSEALCNIEEIKTGIPILMKMLKDKVNE
ncbi:hypothetical protein I4U23_026950 [Adineta vaga]|nr:hypothetical protein I4U23_026950 [Adineta vaga]